jgi:hypothetical protein
MVAVSSRVAHNIQRMKEKSLSSILQDVAVNGSDVESEHAPEHAPIFDVPVAF